MGATRRTRWHTLSITALLVMVSGAAAVLAAGSAAAVTTTHAISCNLVVNSENSKNDSVQLAINGASAGWTICLGAGTFPEQLTIATSGLKVVGAGALKTFIQPPNVTANTVDWDSSAPHAPLAPVVLIANTTGVTLQSLTVNGATASSSITGCSTDFVGVDFQNSTGTLSSDTVNGIQLAASLLGCQNQLAVYAYTGWFTTGFVPSSAMKVTISKTTVTNYGKNGITCDDPGLACTVSGSTVTGLGGTTATAQNGIQIAYGATGSLSTDHVTGDNYTGSSATLDWYGTGYQAAGVLLYQAGSGTSVSHSTFSGDAIAIADVATGSTSVFVTGNSISSFTSYGIVVNGAPGTSALIANNTVNAQATGAPGILVDNGTFNVSGNKISHVSRSGTNGASQVVCGTGSYLACGTTLSVATAAIQAVSEGSGGPTSVTLFANAFSRDSLSVATLAMPTGSVALQFA